MKGAAKIGKRTRYQGAMCDAEVGGGGEGSAGAIIIMRDSRRNTQQDLEKKQFISSKY